jgi:putative membrane protein
VSEAVERKLGSGAWHRLHPLSPFVRAGRAGAALAIVVAPSLVRGGGLGDSYWELGFVGLAVVGGFVSWLVTRWRVEAQELRIETGLVRRSSLRFPLQQVQAIDLVRPGVARVFGLAELRLRMGGSTAGSARLAYLPGADAELLRTRLLALAQRADDGRPAEADERVLVSTPTGRLLASIALSGTGLRTFALVAALVVTLVEWPDVAAEAAGGGLVPVLTAVTLFWRRLNGEYRLTVAEAPDGLRLRSGLVALAAETIRPGRVQAVRMVEPLLWRPFGWCRLELDVAGRQRRGREGAAEGRQLRAVLAVGSLAVAHDLLGRLVADAPLERRPPPRRARWKSPLRFRNLSWGRTDGCVVATGGRIQRVTNWVPLAKVQSIRRVEGPLQRRLRLATVHLDTAGRNVHATIRDRDRAEADEALADLIRLARAARR